MNLKEVREKIIKFGKKDQKLRFKYLKRKKKNSNTSFDEISKFDEISTSFLKKVVSKFGLPIISNFGYEANTYAWFIVQHSSDLDFQIKYLELLKKENPKNIQLKHLAYLEDRVNMYQDKPQKYGTQFVFDEGLGKMVPYTLENPEKVGDYRKKMGLEPLENYSKKFNLNF